MVYKYNKYQETNYNTRMNHRKLQKSTFREYYILSQIFFSSSKVNL